MQMKLNGEGLKNVDHLKVAVTGDRYGADGTIDRHEDRRMAAARSSWRKLTRLLYDQKIPLRLWRIGATDGR